MNKYTFHGSELELFGNAKNWKKYFKSMLIPYIGSTVLEVDAGLGYPTRFLCDGSQKIWIVVFVIHWGRSIVGIWKKV